MPSIKTVWYTGLNKEEQDKLKQILLANTVQNKQFLKVLRSRWESIERKGFTEDDYRTSDWTHLQAFNNGRLSMLKEIADLFNFEGD